MPIPILDLLKRSESAAPLTVSQHDSNMTAIEQAVNSLALASVSLSLAQTPTASELLLHVPVGASITFPAGLANSFGVAITAPGAQYNLSVRKNGTEFAVVRFAAGASTASFIAASAVSFAPGDLLSVYAPSTPDVSIAGIGITLIAQRT
jgi:hypothetical protein